MIYSKTYGMNEPKDGMENLWNDAKAVAYVIDRMVDELPRRIYDYDLRKTQYIRKYIGHIKGWRCKDESYVDLVEFAVDGCEHDVRLFYIDRKLGIDYLMSRRFEMECRERTDTTVTVNVDSHSCILKIDWSVADEQQSD